MVFPVNIQDWFPVGLTGLSSLQSKGLSRVLSNITVQKHQDNLTAAKTKSEELKSLLMKVKEESEKAGLKLHIQKTEWRREDSWESLGLQGDQTSPS